MGISTVSKPHFLKVGKCLTLSVVKGEVSLQSPTWEQPPFRH
jgi:hypothetical protein